MFGRNLFDVNFRFMTMSSIFIALAEAPAVPGMMFFIHRRLDVKMLLPETPNPDVPDGR